MIAKADEIAERLDQLLEDGAGLLPLLSRDEKDADEPNPFTLLNPYQQWYSEAEEVVRVLLPSRVSEFRELYTGGQNLTNPANYGISHFLMGLSVSRVQRTYAVAAQRVMTQLAILRSAKATAASTLFDIEGLLQADLFTNELAAAEELLRKGHLRAAGVVAGVVIEGHLRQTVRHHGITTRKKKPTLNDFNQMLKDASVVKTPTWRFIQGMGDLRNICAHAGEEPTKSEVKDLLAGAAKVLREVN